MGTPPDPADHQPGADSHLLRQRDLAARWGVSVRSLERWRTQGRGPPFLKLVGGAFYRLADVLAYEDAQRRAADLYPITAADDPA